MNMASHKLLNSSFSSWIWSQRGPIEVLLPRSFVDFASFFWVSFCALTASNKRSGHAQASRPRVAPNISKTPFWTLWLWNPLLLDMHVTSVDCQPSLIPKANHCTWTKSAHTHIYICIYIYIWSYIYIHTSLYILYICQWVPSGKRISNFGPCPVRHEPSVQVSPPEMITSHGPSIVKAQVHLKLQLPLSVLVGNGYLRQGQTITTLSILQVCHAHFYFLLLIQCWSSRL